MTNSDFISRYRAAINALLAARGQLKAFREQDTAVGIVASLQPSDFSGTNADLTAADFNAVFAAVDALEAILTDFTATPPSPTASLTALLKFLS